MALDTVSQLPGVVNLRWVEGDPVALSFKVIGNDWSGAYESQIRSGRKATATLIGTFTVTATLVGSDTVFTLTISLADSAAIKAGTYYWDAQVVNGVTRIGGTVIVEPQVTVLS